MADSTDEACWTYHAQEQWDVCPEGHKFTDDAPLVKTLHNLKKVTKVVDLGCGGGLWRAMFKGYDYTGVDQNAGMIQFAQKRWPNDNFRLANGEQTGLEEGSVDLVFTAAVLQHNLHPRKITVVEEIHRILRPKGYYLCTENTFRLDNYHHSFPNKPFHEDLDDGYSLTFSGWEKFMKPLGFKLLKSFGNSEYLYQKE